MEPLSLEKIQKITKIFLKEAFSPFLKLPKKCTFQIINILLAQYQFTSPDDKESIKYQICRLQEFPLSLNLLKLREKSNPRLSSVYHKWAFSWNKRRVTQKKHKHDILIT